MFKTTINILSHSFCESEIWEQLGWVVQAQGLSRGCSNMSSRVWSSEGLTEAGRSSSKMAIHGQQIGADCWLEVLVLLHVGLSIELLKCPHGWLPPGQIIQETKLHCPLWFSFRSHIPSSLQYAVGRTLWGGITQECRYQEVSIIRSHLGGWLPRWVAQKSKCWKTVQSAGGGVGRIQNVKVTVGEMRELEKI